MKNRTKLVVIIIIGLFVIVAQVVEYLANQNLSNSEKIKDDLYSDYERYLDFQTQAQVLRAVYNTLQAVNNTNMQTTLIDREKEMLDYLLTSLYALTNHIEIDKSTWKSMGYYELMDVTLQMNKTVNDAFRSITQDIKLWKSVINGVSSVKFILLSIEVIVVSFVKGDKK